jgi:hypothetical protein
VQLRCHTTPINLMHNQLKHKKRFKLKIRRMVKCTGAYLDSKLGWQSPWLELAPSAPQILAPRDLAYKSIHESREKYAMHEVAMQYDARTRASYSY